MRILKLMFAAAAAVAVATPSLAAPLERHDFLYNSEAMQNYGQNYGYVFRPDGKLLGRDPDANIRFQLNRDGYANEN